MIKFLNIFLNMDFQNWHSLSIEEVIKKLGTNPSAGLSEKKVFLYRKKFGENKISKKDTLSWTKILIDQLKSPLIYILLIAGFLLLFFKETQKDSLVIFFAILVSIIFGFAEEKKASDILSRIKEVLKTKAVVLRNGTKKEIFQEELVPGDIIFLKEGDKIPADARLIEVNDLRVNEAVLTGESISAEKKVSILPKDTPLCDRDNMVYSGCTIEKGRGVAIVVETGDKTEVGKIAKMIQETPEDKTPLQKRLEDFSKKVAIFVLVLCFLIFFMGVLRKHKALEMLETSIAIAVGAIPEGLPITLTVILAVGAGRILKKKGLVRSLKSVETLGSTSIICTDKTKTLTQGKMVPEEIITLKKNIPSSQIRFLQKNDFHDTLFKIATLCNEAFEEKKSDSSGKYYLRGEETDKGLLRAGILYGFRKETLEKRVTFTTRIPFTFENRYQAVLIQENNQKFLYVSGAPEKILSLSTKVKDREKEITLSRKERKILIEKIEEATEKGFRIIALAEKEISKNIIPNSPQKLSNKLVGELTFVGAVVLKDPLRKEIKKTILSCRKAGLYPVIITGDHRKTAKNIASELGLKVKDDEILEGSELDKLSNEEFKRIVTKIKIYARAEPRHKIKIVDAWQEKRKVVAMTGDGVNDAPALKSADVGIAMGSGTEVAKESSDIVLLTDSFSVIVKAIEQGRVILENIRKAVAYTISDSFSSAIIVSFSTIIFGWPLPILPVQILWNNVLVDTFPNIAFAFEPAEKAIMQKKPHKFQESLLGREAFFLTLGNIIFNFFCVFYFWFFYHYLKLGIEYSRTMIFGVLCVNTGFVIFSYKNLKKNIWKINPFSNKFLNLAAILSVVGFAMVLYIPFLRDIFHTVSLGPRSWLFLVVVGIVTTLFLELIKILFIKDKK